MRHLCGSQLYPMSAGLEPGELNPLAVEAMREVGVDIKSRPTQSVFELFPVGKVIRIRRDGLRRDRRGTMPSLSRSHAAAAMELCRSGTF